MEKLDIVHLNQCALYGEKQYCLWSPIFNDLLTHLRDMKVRTDDVWIAGFPRSGTHWLSELCWLICNNLDFETAHKIEQRNRIWYYDLPRPVLFGHEVNQEQIVDHFESFNKMNSQRFIKTHLPLEFLPPKLLETAKMVYIARDPRDVIVSYYRYCKGFKPTSFKGDLKTFYTLFKRGQVPYTPYYQNLIEFWNKRQHPNLLFLQYEEMSKDLPSVVRQVAKFFDREYSDEQFSSLCSHLEFTNLKNNPAVNSTYDPKECEFVRKGFVGGWRKEFDKEMALDAEKWIRETLKTNNIEYPSYIRKTIVIDP